MSHWVEEFRLYRTSIGRYLASIFDFVFPFSNVTLGKSSSTFYICRHLHFARPVHHRLVSWNKNLYSGSVTTCRSWNTACWRPACYWLGWGPWPLVTPVKATSIRVGGYKKSERSTNVTAHAIPIQIRVWLTYTQSWIKCNILVSSKKFNSKLQCECLNPFI